VEGYVNVNELISAPFLAMKSACSFPFVPQLEGIHCIGLLELFLYLQ